MKDEKGLILSILIVALLILFSVATFFSVNILRKQIWKYKEVSYKRALHEVRNAIINYMHKQYIEDISTSSGGKVFPSSLNTLLREGYLSGSDYTECNSLAGYTLCYKNMPIIYYKSLLAQDANCHFVINSNGHVYSGFVAIIVQGPNALSTPNADTFYSTTLKNLIESHNPYVNSINLAGAYSSNLSRIHNDDVYILITANDIAKNYEYNLTRNITLYAHTLYARFRKYISSTLAASNESTVKMFNILSHTSTVYTMCESALRYATNYTGSVYLLPVNRVSYIKLGYAGFIPADLNTLNIKDMKGNNIPLKYKCVLIDSARNKYDLENWPQSRWPLYNYNIVSIDSRLDVEYSIISTNTSISCPAYK